MQTLNEEFCAEVERFLIEYKMDPTIFGRQSLSDPNFVFDLRKGRAPTTRTVDRVRSFMEIYGA